MNIKRFLIKHDNYNLDYYVIVNQIKIDPNKFNLEDIFQFIDEFQGKYSKSTLQFFNSTYLLNENHLFSAIYYTQKAFLNNLNIANTKNIELFLYLATSRQIKVALDRFGVTTTQLAEGKITFCVITQENNGQEMNQYIIDYLSAEKTLFSVNDQSMEKHNLIKDIFEISDDQLTSALKSQEKKSQPIKNQSNELSFVATALLELICEKMAILSLEKVSFS